MMSNIDLIRRDFPILNTIMPNMRKIIYLDNAATSQKPLAVIEAISNFYKYSNGNPSRGTHYLSEVATKEFENCRTKIQKFINAKDPAECIFTKNATEAINLIANSYAERFLNPGDEVLLSIMEHHANIVPWQLLQSKKQINLKFIPMFKSGELDLTNLEELLTAKTKLISITHVSNTLGTINPLKQIITLAHRKNIPVLIDGAQAIGHFKVDVAALDCDFYVFSGHKMFGPTGIGIMYGKKNYLEQMPPYHGGGQMIFKVDLNHSIYREIPYKFEAGTQPVAEAVGLSAAMDYIDNIGLEKIWEHEQALLHYATTHLSQISGVKIIGNSQHKTGIISLILNQIHPHDIGTILNESGIAVRTGHLCTMPIMHFYQVPALTRISFSIYNTFAEIDQLIDGLIQVKKIFKL